MARDFSPPPLPPLSHNKPIKYSKEWELISTSPYVSRLKVPGGWLVCGGNVIFVSDQNYTWVYE